MAQSRKNRMISNSRTLQISESFSGLEVSYGDIQYTIASAPSGKQIQCNGKKIYLQQKSFDKCLAQLILPKISTQQKVFTDLHKWVALSETKSDLTKRLTCAMSIKELDNLRFTPPLIQTLFRKKREKQISTWTGSLTTCSLPEVLFNQIQNSILKPLNNTKMLYSDVLNKIYQTDATFFALIAKLNTHYTLLYCYINTWQNTRLDQWTLTPSWLSEATPQKKDHLQKKALLAKGYPNASLLSQIDILLFKDFDKRVVLTRRWLDEMAFLSELIYDLGPKHFERFQQQCPKTKSPLLDPLIDGTHKPNPEWKLLSKWLETLKNARYYWPDGLVNKIQNKHFIYTNGWAPPKEIAEYHYSKELVDRILWYAKASNHAMQKIFSYLKDRTEANIQRSRWKRRLDYLQTYRNLETNFCASLTALPIPQSVKVDTLNQWNQASSTARQRIKNRILRKYAPSFLQCRQAEHPDVKNAVTFLKAKGQPIKMTDFFGKSPISLEKLGPPKTQKEKFAYMPIAARLEELSLKAR